MTPLSASTPTPRPATEADFLAIPSRQRFHELLDGELVRKAMPSARHGAAQLSLGTLLGPYGPGSQDGQPGGWWLMAEVEVALPGDEIARPDLVGWRVENMPELPETFPIELRPDWVCEIVSPGDSGRDTVIKYRDYARAGIPHYWMVDLTTQRLVTLVLQGPHYTIDREAGLEVTVRAAPFAAVEIPVGLLFGARRR